MSNRPLRVLVLSLDDAEASLRYRVTQFEDALKANGIELQTSPFFVDLQPKKGRYHRWRDGWTRRCRELFERRKFDALLVHRFSVPRALNSMVRWFSLPIVYDFDDAIWLRDARGETSTREFATLVRSSSVVLAGNPFLEQQAWRAGGRRVVVAPTVVDVEKFLPRARAPAALPVVGWIGSPHTFPYLQPWLRELDRLAAAQPFVLRLVGAGQQVALSNAKVEQPAWTATAEPELVASFDIGLYPLAPDPWVQGKCALKALQYMSCEIPFVVSPFGVVADIAAHKEVALHGVTPEQAADQVGALLKDATLRRRLGERGRQTVLHHFTLAHGSQTLSDALRTAALHRVRD